MRSVYVRNAAKHFTAHADGRFPAGVMQNHGENGHRSIMTYAADVMPESAGRKKGSRGCMWISALTLAKGPGTDFPLP